MNEQNDRKDVVHAYMMYLFECMQYYHDYMYADVKLNIWNVVCIIHECS